MIGQTIGALSLSPSKSTPLPVSVTSRPVAITTALGTTLNSSTITSSSTQLLPRVSLPTSSQQQVVPSFTMICQPGTSASSSAPPVGDDHTAHNRPLNKSPAQANPTVQSTPAPSSPSAPKSQPSHVSGMFKETNVFSQLAPSKSQISALPPATTNAQFSTSSSGTIQQRIVINTAAPLAAGTQILLNNARFVVPPQGLGPGSHVLIISSPAPQQVPPAITASTGAPGPPQRATQDNTAPQAPVSPCLPVRLPTAPAASCPFVACAPTAAPSLRASTADKPVQLHCMGSTVLSGKANGNYTTATPTLVSFPSRLGAPGLISSVVNSVSVARPGLANNACRNMLPAATPAQVDSSPAVAHSLSRMSAPLSSLAASGSPLIPTPSVIARTPALLSQQVASVTTAGPVMQPQQGTAAASHGPVHIRLDNTSVQKLGPAVIQTVLAGAKTQVPPTVAIPSLAGGVSRMQTLPIATVPPIGNAVHAFETTPVAAAPSSSSTVLMTSAQTVWSQKTNNNSHNSMPALTDQALGKHSPETTSKGIHANVASRLLISPDGAILNTVQCQPRAADMTACSGTKESRVVFYNSSTGELRTLDSDLQPSQAERS